MASPHRKNLGASRKARKTRATTRRQEFVPRYPLLRAISLKKANARQECLQASPEWFTANVCANIDRVLSLSDR
jgi:hypothetical protein